MLHIQCIAHVNVLTCHENLRAGPVPATCNLSMNTSTYCTKRGLTLTWLKRQHWRGSSAASWHLRDQRTSVAAALSLHAREPPATCAQRGHSCRSVPRLLWTPRLRTLCLCCAAAQPARPAPRARACFACSRRTSASSAFAALSCSRRSSALFCATSSFF